MSATPAAAAASSPAAAAGDEKSSRFPPWLGPHGESNLKVRNSLVHDPKIAQQKVPFIPAKGNFVGWYTCGPTVYDSAHLGHARCYVTFDIIRRILSDYFRYNVFYVMNITDLDDKIIIRSRRNHLLASYEKEAKDVAKVKADIAAAFKTALAKGESKVAKAQSELSEATATGKFLADMQTAFDEEKAKFVMLEGEFKTFTSLADNKDASVKDLIAAGKGVLSEALDAVSGATMTDHSIFKAHASFYENEFLEDMRALGVRDADALTRVTEYVDHIIKYVQGIIANGHAYEVNGSVYFDTAKYIKDGYHYAKLSPSAVGNVNLTQAGEGALTTDTLGRKSGQDFALWKTSKKGEPAWNSPWGEGRPGWHIECSAMASDLLGKTFDVHSGGTDLKFPHHDNEIAQSESHGKCSQWVNHFWHAGHLSIQGLKMSKSLKNFLTIRDVLRKYSGRTLRFLFLLTSWDKTMAFSDDSLKAAATRETMFNEFFANTAIAVRAAAKIGATPQLWNEDDRKLHDKLTAVREDVHNALLDNFDYPRAMDLLTELILDSNKYRQLPSAAGGAPEPKVMLLQQVARYIDSMMRVFGVVPDPEPGFVSTGGDDGKLAGVLDAACAFRDAMRDAVRAKKTPQEVLAMCDRFRDEAMIELGVRMEDVTTAAPAAAASAAASSSSVSAPAPAASSSVRSVWKLDDPEKLRRERDEKRAAEGAARVSKLRNKLDKAIKDLAKLSEGATSARDYFASQKDKYSQFDADGKPTHDQAGVELTKSALKSIAKTWETRDKAAKEFSAKKEKNPHVIEEAQKEIADMQAEIAKLEAN